MQYLLHVFIDKIMHLMGLSKNTLQEISKTDCNQRCMDRETNAFTICSFYTHLWFILRPVFGFGFSLITENLQSLTHIRLKTYSHWLTEEWKLTFINSQKNENLHSLTHRRLKTYSHWLIENWHLAVIDSQKTENLQSLTHRRLKTAVMFPTKDCSQKTKEFGKRQ